jgi:hypothetical protein
MFRNMLDHLQGFNCLLPYVYFFPMARQPLGGLGRLIVKASRSHFLDTPHSVGLLWTSDQTVAETSTCP